MKRYLFEVRGIVQGVGFRPFIYRIAKSIGVTGNTKNDSKCVYIEVQGEDYVISLFKKKLLDEYPKAGEIFEIVEKEIDVILGEKDFTILESSKADQTFPVIPPDIATCKDCIAEIFDRSQRRYLYPFTNCTNCGPRFSIVLDIPYDRCNTSMKDFEMCEECEREYKNVLDRRFHAQPIACPKCGPHILLLDANGNRLVEFQEDYCEYNWNVIEKLAELIKCGYIVALKGIGGFQLLCDATNEKAVLNLRSRKHREEKPFALMFKDLDHVKEYVYVSDIEEKWLTSYIAPIVILKVKNWGDISRNVSIRNPYLGVMLPYSPLHHILMRTIDIPVVCTSGNLSDEPICISNQEAFDRLRGIADYFLVHDRNIVRHVDDSVIKVTPEGREIIIRRARGFVPKPIQIKGSGLKILAVGGFLKNTVSVSVDENIITSQHIGDLETLESINAFRRVIQDLLRFFNVRPDFIGCDMHPDYVSTNVAQEISNENKIKLVKVQHHIAHVFSCLFENGIYKPERVLGIAWDGTGYGIDGKIWGSEFFYINGNDVERLYHILPINLAGGEKAIREVYRIGVALLLQTGFDSDLIFEVFSTQKYVKNIVSMLKNGLYVESSGMGRLFDGVSSLVGISNYSNFEGQSAMELEFSVDTTKRDFKSYSFDIRDGVIDWRPMVIEIVNDLRGKTSVGEISRKFHNTLVDIILSVVREQKERRDIQYVAISGGVFQNAYLLDRVITSLEKNNITVLYQRKFPPNDGGLSVGQIGYIYNFSDFL